MSQFLYEYQHVFAALLFLGVLYLVWKEAGFELGVGDSTPAVPATSGFRRGFRRR